MANSILGRITPLHLQVRSKHHIARAPRPFSSGEILMTQPFDLTNHSTVTQHSCCMPSFASSDIFGMQLPRSSLLLESNTWLRFRFVCFIVNDPSAGSPTETLLRLLLPLNVKAYSTLPIYESGCPDKQAAPKSSPERSIGRSDGRCVQRAGT